MKLNRTELALTAGILAAATALCTGLPAYSADTWVRLESKNIIVFSNASEKDALAYIASLEAFNTLAKAYYRKIASSEVTGGKFTSYYYKKYDDYRTFETNGEGRLRIHSTCRDGYASLWTSDKDVNASWQLYQFAGLNTIISSLYDMREMPKWVSTGLYTFLASAEVKENSISVGQPARGQYEVFNPNNGGILSLTNKNDRLPFGDVLSGKYSKPERAIMAPAQSWIIMHYMLTSTPENAGKLYRFADDYNFGMDAKTAWQKDIDLDPTFFDQVVTDYKTAGVPSLTYKITDLDDKVTVTPLAKANADIPLLSIAAQTCPDEKNTQRILTQLALAASQTPDDAYTARENARAQILLGTPESALPYIASGLKSAPDDADLNYLMGRLYLARAEAGVDPKVNFAQARASLGKSYKLNKDYAPTLYNYARAFADQPDYPSDNTLASAEAADALMATVDFTLYLAELYARRDMYEDVDNSLQKHRTPEGNTAYDMLADKIASASKGRKKEEIVTLLVNFPREDRFKKVKAK